MASFAAFATRNFTTVFALIWIGSPVCGLRPMRALRCAFTRRPRPGTTNTPLFLVSLIAVSARCSRNAAAVLLFNSVFSARWRTSCVLVKPAAMNPPLLKLNFMLECGAILIPAPVEKQQNRRILRGFQHAGTKNSQIISGFAQAQDARAFAGEEKSFVPGCVKRDRKLLRNRCNKHSLS